jgi:hypothetical protein
MRRTALFVGVLALGLAASGTPADDDLAVIRKAVTTASAEDAPKGGGPAAAAAAPARKGGAPQWLRVRVQEKGTKNKKVSINLPLALAHALGDELPIHWHCHGRDEERCSIKIADVLKTLESGQDLVEVDDDEATVRVWVE